MYYRLNIVSTRRGDVCVGATLACSRLLLCESSSCNRLQNRDRCSVQFYIATQPHQNTLRRSSVHLFNWRKLYLGTRLRIIHSFPTSSWVSLCVVAFYSAGRRRARFTRFVRDRRRVGITWFKQWEQPTTQNIQLNCTQQILINRTRRLSCLCIYEKMGPNVRQINVLFITDICSVCAFYVRLVSCVLCLLCARNEQINI